MAFEPIEIKGQCAIRKWASNLTDNVGLYGKVLGHCQRCLFCEFNSRTLGTNGIIASDE